MRKERSEIDKKYDAFLARMKRSKVDYVNQLFSDWPMSNDPEFERAWIEYQAEGQARYAREHES